MAYDTALASRVLDHVDRDRLEMSTWVEDDLVLSQVMGGRVPEVDCETTACLAGWTVIEKMRDPATTDADRHRIAGQVVREDWAKAAAEILGVPVYSPDEYKTYTPEMQRLSSIFSFCDADEAVGRFRRMFQPDPASSPT